MKETGSYGGADMSPDKPLAPFSSDFVKLSNCCPNEAVSKPMQTLGGAVPRQ